MTTAPHGSDQPGTSSRARPMLRRPLWRLGLAYGALLVASWVVMLQPAPPASPGSMGRAARELPTFSDDGVPLASAAGASPAPAAPAAPAAPTAPTAPAATTATVAYLDTAASPDLGTDSQTEGGDGPPLVLFHGSPGSAGDFVRLLPDLSAARRLIVPDLPGFGASERDVPSYSARAHAAYAAALLDDLGVDRAHVLGFSMGGAVALELAAVAPERVLSVTMLASIGVEELELLGDHTLNHGLHGLQLAALQAARWLLPHFGALDQGMLTRQYARNFFDTDQRRLRPILEELALPTLIIHGEDDFLVPVAAAQEHARIVPQAELSVAASPRGHFIPWTEPRWIAGLVADFLARVDRGEGRTRARATPERVERSAAAFDPSGVPPFEGPAWLAVLLLLALGTLVSEDLSCIAAGLLVADGRLGFVAAAGACFVGIFVGDLALFALGRLLGRPALAARPMRWIVTESAVERASRWFERKGIAVIFLSRFTPGLRLPTYVAAGLLRTPLGTFAGFFALAGLIWTPLLVGVAASAGEALAERLGSLGAAELPWVLGLVVLLMQLYRLLPLTLTHTGRRRLRGRWVRLTRWEFWPPLLTYPPVLLWILWLALRHRSLSVVTAANPGIPASGVVGESKSLILDALDPDSPEIAGHTLLSAAASPAAREQAATRFMERFGADFPVIVKPDAGQRGSGVRMAPDAETLLRWAREVRHDAIIQERIDGPEFGIFYAHEPGAAEGDVLGVTIKLLPTVEGDGQRTVEALLLEDDRACAMHGAYMDELGARAEDVPGAGVQVPLVKVGTHSRGAIFLDGEHLITPALREAMNRIAARFDGFHLGRFDVRAPSAEALARGEGLGVIELNGLTSEPTEIYDPAMPLRSAYRKLFDQWRLAFEIGAANVARGATTTSLPSILREWVRYQRAQRTHTT